MSGTRSIAVRCTLRESFLYVARTIATFQYANSPGDKLALCLPEQVAFSDWSNAGERVVISRAQPLELAAHSGDAGLSATVSLVLRADCLAWHGPGCFHDGVSGVCGFAQPDRCCPQSIWQ